MTKYVYQRAQCILPNTTRLTPGSEIRLDRMSHLHQRSDARQGEERRLTLFYIFPTDSYVCTAQLRAVYFFHVSPPFSLLPPSLLIIYLIIKKNLKLKCHD